MKNEINAYLDYIFENYKEWQGMSRPEDEVARQVRQEMTEAFGNKLRFTEGKKYIKVIAGTSVHSFIVKEDGPKFKRGDILKAASWNAPATNFARGNILTFFYGRIRWTGA